jgi:hypothetical protein
VRAFHDHGELGQLLGAPGDEECADARDGNPDPVRVLLEQEAAPRDELRLEGSRLRIEAGVQQRRVGLARARADVGAGFQQRTVELETRELTCDRRADDARADDDDVVIQV